MKSKVELERENNDLRRHRLAIQQQLDLLQAAHDRLQDRLSEMGKNHTRDKDKLTDELTQLQQRLIAADRRAAAFAQQLAAVRFVANAELPR